MTTFVLVLMGFIGPQHDKPYSMAVNVYDTNENCQLAAAKYLGEIPEAAKVRAQCIKVDY